MFVWLSSSECDVQWWCTDPGEDGRRGIRYLQPLWQRHTGLPGTVLIYRLDKRPLWMYNLFTFCSYICIVFDTQNGCRFSVNIKLPIALHVGRHCWTVCDYHTKSRNTHSAINKSANPQSSHGLIKCIPFLLVSSSADETQRHPPVITNQRSPLTFK